MRDHSNEDRPTVIGIGFSHLGALMRAQDLRQSRRETRFDVEWMTMFPSDRYDPWVRAEDGRIIYHSAFVEDLELIVRRTNPRCVLMSMWGNQHFFRSCARGKPSFDFVLPWAPDRGRIADSEIVPFDLIQRMLRHTFELPDGLTRLVAEMVPCPVYTMAAPPAVGPVEDIPAGTSSVELDDLVKKFGVADPLLRWKFWSVCERLAREFAGAMGLRMLPPPPQTFDPQGYRAREFWGTDWLHGNTAYGEAVLRQVDRLLDEDAS